MTDKEREAFIAGYKAGRRGIKPKFSVKHKPMFETDKAKVKEMSKKVADIFASVIDVIDAKQEAYFEMLMSLGNLKASDDEITTMPKHDIGNDFEGE